MTAEIAEFREPRQPRPRPLQSLLASAKRLTSQDLSRVKRRQSSTTASWQEDAWEMYDLVGEERFLATTLAGRLSQAKLFVGRMDPDDVSDDPIPVEIDEINDVLTALGKTYAGRQQLLHRLAINLFVAGDGWLAGIPEHLITQSDDGPPPPEPGEPIPIESLEWKMLSVSEVSTNTSGQIQIQLTDVEGDLLEVSPEQVYLIRIWRPHPRRWWEADSPTRASLPVLKELVGLTMHVSAQVDSRLAGAGLLVVAQSAQRALQLAAGIEEDVTTDQFTDALIEAMLTPIKDRSSASALVPLVVTVPDEIVEKFNYITFSTPLDAEARGLREEAIRRLALGQDAPPEILLGTSGMNHWGGWLVQEDTVRSHIEPPLALICDALTTQYLWPVLREQGVKDHEDYVVWYDVSHLISRPNRSTDALALYDRGELNGDSLRSNLGFDTDDAPETQEDKDRVADIVLRMLEANPALIQRPGLGVIIQQVSDVIAGRTPPPYDPRAASAANGAAPAAAPTQPEPPQQVSPVSPEAVSTKVEMPQQSESAPAPVG